MTAENRCILAVDHGTSGVKTALVDLKGCVLDFESRKLPTLFLDDGGVEQDPEQWWRATAETSRALAARNPESAAAVAAVCVSSTFSTTVAVDEGGAPLMNALTWMDSRGAPYVRDRMKGFPSIQGYGLKNVFRWISRTGGGPSLSGKDDIAHVLYLQHRRPEIYRSTHMFLPSKDFLNFKLTGKMAATYDSITLFWVTDNRDVENVRYDDRLIRLLGIDREKLPPLRKSIDILGALLPEAAAAMGLPQTGIRVVAGSPDHQAAGVGAGAVRDYQAHLYVGTSSWIQCPVPFKKTDMFHSIASLPFAVPGKYYCANEQDMAGGCLEFLLNQILCPAGEKPGFLKPEPFLQVDAMAKKIAPGSGNLIFAPWLNGERTPVDEPFLRGAFFNLSTLTTTAHMVRALLEGVAYNTRWALTHVERFVGRRLEPLNIVGGGAQSDVWCQIMADVLNRRIRQVRDPIRANARGAAFIAAVGLGCIAFDDIPDHMKYRRTFTPDPANLAVYHRLYHEFRRFHRATRRICRRLNT